MISDIICVLLCFSSISKMSVRNVCCHTRLNIFTNELFHMLNLKLLKKRMQFRQIFNNILPCKLSTSQGMLFVGGHGERLCQCRSAFIQTDKTFPVQIDGEPCKYVASYNNVVTNLTAGIAHLRATFLKANLFCNDLLPLTAVTYCFIFHALVINMICCVIAMPF